MSGTYTHRPVLLEECIQGLAIRPDGLYIDGTLGRGGHSEEIVKRLTQGGRLICIDRDSQAEYEIETFFSLPKRCCRQSNSQTRKTDG